jgi:hypothetical protein
MLLRTITVVLQVVQASLWLLVALVALIACGAFGLTDFNPHPDDRWYITTFHQHEVQFNELIALGQTDSYVLWNSSDTFKIPEQNRRRYTELLGQLDLKISELNARQDNSVLLFTTSRRDNWLGLRSSKGYLYSRNEPEYVDSSLDGFSLYQTSGIVCRRLTDHWFVYRMCDD